MMMKSSCFLIPTHNLLLHELLSKCDERLKVRGHLSWGAMKMRKKRKTRRTKKGGMTKMNATPRILVNPQQRRARNGGDEQEVEEKIEERRSIDGHHFQNKRKKKRRRKMMTVMLIRMNSTVHSQRNHLLGS